MTMVSKQNKKEIKNCQIKCLALDLDGTALNDAKEFSPRTQLALRAAMDAGIHVVIASGRSFHTLPDSVLSFPGLEYAITSNGACIYRIADQKELHGYRLSPASVEAILKLTKEEPITYEGFVRGQAFADLRYVQNPVSFGASEAAVHYVKATRTMKKDIVAFIREHQQELDSLDLIVATSEKKEQLIRLLTAQIPDIYVTSSVAQLVEISNIQAGKHSGLSYLSGLLGIQMAQIAAFGNADNDIDMMTHSGLAFAVCDADPACLKAADIIVGHHNEDGVAEGIELILKQI